MSEEQTKEIRRRLDQELSLEEFERDYRSTGEAATQFFQDLFVQVLNFDETTSPLGDATWQDIPVHDWPNSTRADAARLFAEAGNFRIIYVELEKLTRTAERNAIQSLTRSDKTSGWAIDGSFLTVFHAPDEDIWHLVTPYQEGTDDITTGRPVLRRYTLGEGETHRTVANSLSSMDASKGRLAERIDDAFRIKPITEDFYDNYKNAFKTLSKELRKKGLEIEAADRYSHMTLNRLMFFYYLQKKGWIGNRKDFVRWFHEQYKQSDAEDVFHEKWLSALFFDGMNSPEDSAISIDLPPDVESEITQLPYMNGGLFQPSQEDESNTFLSDSALTSVIEGFLEQYNFTVTEESPYDIDVAVDPAMLGKIYESLIAEQERGEAGIFYTPRKEVDYMCRLSLYEQFCDHASNVDNNGKRKIAEFIFEEPQNWNLSEVEGVADIKNILHNIRIVDPACGSGAFLVGMMQVLTELYRKLGVTVDYDVKERIINENLNGVDIKDWAIRVSEFRLWLSLVEGEDDIPHERPLLPSFTFKLRSGDSLVQKIGDEFITMESLSRSVAGEAENILSDVKKLKQKHFEGDDDLKNDIREMEMELIRTHIDEQIKKLENRTTQQTLSGKTKSSGDIDAQIENLQSLRRSLDATKDNDFFMWDLDFSDIILEGGFDIVIGNPPYIAHQELVPQDIPQDVQEELKEADEFDEIKDAYKSDLREYCQRVWDYKPYKKSDIYLYFFFRGMDLLRPNGTLTFITSNAWLDVGYGKRLQEFLLKEGDISMIMDSQQHSVFDEAEVNTTITVAQNASEEPDDRNPESQFIELKAEYGEIAEPNKIISLLNIDSQSEGDDYQESRYITEKFGVRSQDWFRDVKVSRKTLWRLGDGSVSKRDGTLSGKYRGNMWGALFHRAPDSFFSVMQEASDEFFKIEKSDIETYLNTGGADDFFFIDICKEESGNYNNKEDEDFVEISTESGENFKVESKYIVPFLESSKEIDSLQITTEGVDSHLLSIPKSVNRENLKEESVWEYIQWGEERGYDKKSGRRRKDRWEILPDQAYDTSQILVGCYMDQPRVYHNRDQVISHRFFRVYSRDRDSDLLAASMNSSVTLLSYELFRNPSLGGGVLAVGTASITRFLVVDPADLDLDSQVVQSFLSRNQESIKKEIGLDPDLDIPLSEQEPNPKEDRKAIDDAVFDSIGVSPEIKKDVYRSLVALTHERKSNNN